jgi:hypothetical protein
VTFAQPFRRPKEEHSQDLPKDWTPAGVEQVHGQQAVVMRGDPMKVRKAVALGAALAATTTGMTLGLSGIRRPVRARGDRDRVEHFPDR